MSNGTFAALLMVGVISASARIAWAEENVRAAALAKVLPTAKVTLNGLLQHIADVPLGGRTTRLDYASLDPERHLLFMAHLGDSTVIVFDTQAQRVVTRISGISQVHGVLAVPELGLLGPCQRRQGTCGHQCRRDSDGLRLTS